MKLILKKDYVIPAGTVFDSILGGMKRTYGTGNYETLISTSKDTVMSINVTKDELACTDLFKEDI